MVRDWELQVTGYEESIELGGLVRSPHFSFSTMSDLSFLQSVSQDFRYSNSESKNTSLTFALGARFRYSS